MDFEEFKAQVCEVFGLDRERLPSGFQFAEYPRQVADDELFDEEFVLASGRTSLLSYFPERPLNQWHTSYRSLQASGHELDEKIKRVVLEALG